MFKKIFFLSGLLGLMLASCNSSKTELPDLRLKLFQGNYINFKDDCKNKITIINIWSTFCGPCLEELPAINQLYETLKANKNVKFLTIAMNTEDELDQFVYSTDTSNPYKRAFLLSKVQRLTMPIAIGSKSGYIISNQKNGKFIAHVADIKEDDMVYHAFNFRAVPTTLIYNNGVLVYKIPGNDSNLKGKIDSLLRSNILF